MRNHLEPPKPFILKLKRASEDALAAASLEELLGIEGAAASQYFQQFNGMVKVEDDLPGLEMPGKDFQTACIQFQLYQSQPPSANRSRQRYAFPWLSMFQQGLHTRRLGSRF